jgi:hypothetical protein
MKYAVAPGIYAVGAPTADSPVFVSANYAMSFNLLRRHVHGIDGWILVIDTNGINVWCAAGKGTFGTRELMGRIMAVRLDTIVTHRVIIVPQLGAPGIQSHVVRKATGFSILFGPVRARDIPAFLAAGRTATRAMRTVSFSLVERLELTPLEVIPALRLFAIAAVILAVFCGIQPQGIIFKEALLGAGPFMLLGLAALVSGSILTPLLLPFIPFRAFSMKGWLMGLVVTLPLLRPLFGDPAGAILPMSLSALFFPALSSYLAFNFTGCTTYTSISGVKYELKIALPVYISVAAVSVLLLIGYQCLRWGLL